MIKVYSFMKGFSVQSNLLMSDGPLAEVWLGSLPHDPSALKIARQGRVYGCFRRSRVVWGFRV